MSKTGVMVDRPKPQGVQESKGWVGPRLSRTVPCPVQCSLLWCIAEMCSFVQCSKVQLERFCRWSCSSPTPGIKVALLPSASSPPAALPGSTCRSAEHLQKYSKVQDQSRTKLDKLNAQVLCNLWSCSVREGGEGRDPTKHSVSGLLHSPSYCSHGPVLPELCSLPSCTTIPRPCTCIPHPSTCIPCPSTTTPRPCTSLPRPCTSLPYPCPCLPPSEGGAQALQL